ncbi:MAG TPA: ABC transporter permease [Halanaerobiales bacterium]|nr:ABC transporter permease [Halanaerobiales bacterium]
MTLFKHALKLSFSQPVNILVIFILPLAALFIPAEGDSFPHGLSIYGMINLFSAFLLARLIIEDRSSKIIIRVLSTPISYFDYLKSYLLGFLLILTVQNIIFTLGVYFYWGEVVFNHGLIFILYFLFSIMTIALSLCWNSFFRSYNISFALFSGVGSVMCLISGISIPLQIYSNSIRNKIMILPTYWLPSGLEAVYNGKIASVIISYIVLLVYSGVLLLLGSKRRY